jgi:hypothetical protein
MIEDINIQVDMKQTIYDALNQEKDEAFKARLSRLKEDAEIPSDDHDMDERLKYAIKGLTELMNTGLEVHPSLTAPPEIRKQFPDAAEISETLKLLTPAKTNGADLENKVISNDQQ